MLTAPSRGAIAVIGLSGRAADKLLSTQWSSATRKHPEELPRNRISFGYWKLPGGDREEVVVCRTNSTVWEIHCHGGRLASRALLESLRSQGAEVVDRHQWLANTIPDRFQRDALERLSQAPTMRTAAILADQFRGALRRAWLEIQQLAERGDREDARNRIAELHSWTAFGLHLVEPWKVLVTGKPNVGKSSLINALLGYERAITSERPGTTRDVLRARTALDGFPIEFWDTAGLRTPKDIVEQAGIERARRYGSAADLVVYVVDATTGWTERDQQRVAQYSSSLVVANKVDLVDHMAPCPVPIIPTSVLKNQGIEALADALVAALVPNVPRPGQAVPFTPDHADLALAAQSVVESPVRLRQLLRPWLASP